MDELQGLHVMIDADLHRRLKVHSAETGTPMRELVEEALNAFLAKAGKARKGKG